MPYGFEVCYSRNSERTFLVHIVYQQLQRSFGVSDQMSGILHHLWMQQSFWPIHIEIAMVANIHILALGWDH